MNRAEKNDLEIEKGTSNALFMKFLGLYKDMLSRKKFVPGSDVHEFQKIQRDLPNCLKMMIFLCKENNNPISGVICSSAQLGNRGIYLHGATIDKGLKSQGAYKLQWEMIKYYKEAGCRWFDLGGINKQQNPGVYHFKTGISKNKVNYLKDI